ncbi:hypothetical protein BKG77_07055 [Mycobacteroides chelonae]|uniref:hypothetical protein n=1 Tax=Mycobacteroides chelonae TaxID=1774 RepID=UPI0008A9AC43|nr:hypothetical protein [Mycobacteroides chelonae]OHU23415.1 hypothetical protein BKG77_07055 [Mycobacteroides chelonae]
MELVKVLAPPVAALVALIAVFVSLRNTRKQIEANAANLKAQLAASADNLKTQLAASADNLEKQLYSQAQQAHAGRRAQLEHMVRAERRDMLINAAQVVLKFQGYSRDVHAMRQKQAPPDPAAMQMVFEKVDAEEDELSFIAAGMEIIDLTDHAEHLRLTYYSAFMSYLHLYPWEAWGLVGDKGIRELEAYTALAELAGSTLDQFAAAIRVGPDPYAP